MTLVTMSKEGFSRLAVLQDSQAGRLGVGEVAALLGVTRRQVFRLQKAFLAEGPAALASRKRGQPGNRRAPGGTRREVLAIICERYADFGPTLAAEKLAQCHGLPFSRETLRLWMVAEGLWQDRKARQKAAHQPRPRRDCAGELVRIDGSEHWRSGARAAMHAAGVVDDATSRLLRLKFVETESAFAYFAATRGYLERHGKPVAFYSDKASVFRANKTLQDRLARSCACKASTRWRRATRCCRPSWRTTTPASPRNRPTPRTCTARSPQAKT